LFANEEPIRARENVLVTKRWAHVILSLAFIFPMSEPTRTLAQDAQKSPVQGKWRPKDGLYASPGKGFAGICQESGDLILGLRENDISGHEWGCRVRKVTDTAPDAIRIDMTCSDYNLAEDLKKPEDTEFKEVMLLKKVDDKSMLVRKTVDRKFKDPEWKAVYCPKVAQQLYRDGIAENRAKREQEKAAAKTTWQPHDGVYASPGADFDDRCAKNPDLIIRLRQSAATIGPTSCYVAHVSVEPPGSVTLDANCEGLVTTVVLSKVDDQSLLLGESRPGQAARTNQSLSYCPPAAQRDFTESKSK